MAHAQDAALPEGEALVDPQRQGDALDMDLGDMAGVDPATERAMRRFLANPSAPPTVVGYAWETGLVAPWVPCTPTQLDGALSYMRLSPDSLLLDLGCGDGRILLKAVECFGCYARGIDLDREVLSQGEAAREALPEPIQGRIDFVHGDIFETSLWPSAGGRLATHIVLYLLPDGLRKLGPLLEPSLRDGAFLCTLGWSMPGWDEWQCAQDAGQWYAYSCNAPGPAEAPEVPGSQR